MIENVQFKTRSDKFDDRNKSRLFDETRLGETPVGEQIIVIDECGPRVLRRTKETSGA